MLAPFQPPAYFTWPTLHRTIGPVVTKLTSRSPVPPDLHQRLILDCVFAKTWAEDCTEIPAAFEVGIIGARQNIKTSTLIQIVIGWLVFEDARKIVWSAHELATATDTAARLHAELKENPLTRHLLPETKNEGLYLANGQARIELVTGQRVVVKARTAGGGRGLVGDKVILDESYALKPRQLGALLPTMMTKPQGQVVYASTAGDEHAEALREVRDRGRVGDTRLVWIEWCAPHRDCESADCDHKDRKDPGCALNDFELAKPANPAWLAGRIGREAIESMRRSLDPAEYMREILGWWEDPAGEALTIDDLIVEWDTWTGLWNGEDPDPASLVLAVRRSTDLGKLAVCGGWLWPDGRKHIGAVLRSPDLRAAAEEVARIQTERGCRVMIDDRDPGGKTTAKLLKDAKVKLTTMTFDDMTEACAELIVGVNDKLVTHFGEDLDDDLLVARLRPAGSRRLLAGRKGADVAMLEAGSMAAWAAGRKAKSYAH